MTGDEASNALARHAVAGLRSDLVGRNAARMARSLGISGGLGLGSIVYGLAVIGALLQDDSILDDAHRCSELIADDLVDDRQLDVLGGSAGAILGLLRFAPPEQGDDAALRSAENAGGC